MGKDVSFPALYSSVRKAYYAYCDKLGIPRKSTHKARKTFISALFDAGFNLNTIRQIAGHVDEKTTLNNYIYDRSPKSERAERMEGALSFASLMGEILEKE